MSIFYSSKIHSGFPVSEGAEMAERFFRIINTASDID